MATNSPNPDVELNPEDFAKGASLTGGLVNPLTYDLKLEDLPQPPISYPPTVQPSRLVPSIKSVPSNSSQSIADDIHNLGQTADKWGRNPYSFSKEKVYNADYDGANFKRYSSVDRVFKKKGFHPYLDNEAIYNQEATWWDYHKRAVGGAADAFASSFSSMLPWNGWGTVGDASDIESAKQIERAHAIAHDSRGGVGSWVNNFTVDSGITFGILAEMGAEELAIWAGSIALAPESFGSSLGAGAIAAGNNIRKGIKGFTNIFKMGEKLSGTMKWLKSADKMRDVWNYTTKSAKYLGDKLAPETGKWMANLIEDGINLKQGENLMSMARASKGFGAFYRDGRAFMAMHTEAAMEGGSTELKVRNDLIDEYIKTHNGQQPNQQDLNNIYMQAANAGRETYQWNLPALYISNAIVFDKALKGWKPMRAFAEELEAGIKGKLKFNEAWKAAGGKAWEVVDDGLKGTWKSLTTASTYKPKNLLKNLLGKFTQYSAANLTEGIQEMYQDAVQGTMDEYYKDRFHHPGMEGSRSVWGAFAKNVGKTVTSGEGWNTFASGFLMGSVVQFPQKLAFEYAPMQFKKITDRAGYDAYMERMEKHTNNVVNALNAATMDDKFFDGITENAVHQMNANREADAANAAGDKHSYYDIIDQSVFNHMHTLLRSGKIDLIRDQIEDLKGLNKKDLEEAFGPTTEEEGDSYEVHQKRLNSMLNKIDLVNKHYQKIESKFKNRFDPSRYKKGTQEYEMELDAYNAFEDSKKAAVYSNYAFERAVERMESIVKDVAANKPIGEAAASDFTLLLNRTLYEREIENLKQEVEEYNKGDKQSVERAYEAQRKLNRLEKYKDAVDKYQTALEIDAKRQAGLDSKDISDAEREGKIVEGTKVKNKKGNEHTVDYVKKGVAYNKKGEKIGKVKDLEILSGESEMDFLDEAASSLFKAYRSYLKEVAADRRTFAKDEDIMSSFEKLKDYHKLDRDAIEMSRAVDILHNPTQFTEFASRTAQVISQIRKQKRDKIEESYKKFLEMRRTNELFNELYKMGVFLDEDGMQSVLDDEMPASFYDIASREEINPSSAKYKEILDLFEKYEETNQKTFKKKPITGQEKAEVNYTTVNRNKINNDTRTYKEHAAYWGFDPDLTKTSKVNTREILKKIISSKYATAREKQLARRLLTKVSEQSEITFAPNLSQPGVYNYDSEGNAIGVFINPKYVSEDYTNGTHPIETLFLHELVHEVTTNEMAKDPVFRGEIEKLLKAAKEAYEKNPPSDFTLYRKATQKEFYGLKNEFEFMAELFTNDRFAAWLNTIPYETTGKTVWTEFLDKLKTFLARMLGVRQDSTLLDEALYIATSYIDKTRGTGESISKEEQAAIAQGKKGALTMSSTIEQFRGAGLLEDMLKEYRAFAKDRIGPDRIVAEEWSDPDVAQKTDDELAESEGFRKYLATSPLPIQRMLDKHNGVAEVKPKAEQPKAQAPPKVETETEAERLYGKGFREVEADEILVPGYEVKINQTTGKSYTNAPKRAQTQQPSGAPVEKASLAQKRQLVNDLGYTYNEVESFSAEEAQRLLDENLTKEQRQAAKKREEEAEVARVAEEKEQRIKTLEDEIDSVEFIEDFDNVYKKISQALSEDPLGVDTDRLDARIEARKKELATNLKFEDIEVGNGVIMRDDYNSKKVVVGKDENTLYLRRYDQPVAGDVEMVSKDQVTDKILYKHQPSIPSMVISEPVSEQAQQASNENQQAVQQPVDNQEIIDDIQSARTMSAEEIDDEFNNNLGCP